MRRLLPKPEWVADAGLAGLVVLIIGMMIIPLPPFLLDILIVTNITIGVLMLLVGMVIPNGLSFAAMPTVLLVTTLFRLALNISSTRLILLHAYAGQVIQSFGEFVVRGDYIVGAVIFLIITVIQYFVIAKGSERVAEVGARFTLDAMPGKQMAIDADLRAGSISSSQAQRRRFLIQRENQFYGAMDGAMKFVKGDAIAGVFISFVNIIAGVGIGVGSHDMEILESLQVYGLLTVGDGLVSQIPSLLISTSAGVIVTRVASEQEDRSLGTDIGFQLFGNSRVLIMCAMLLLLLALVPGIPAVPFLFLAVILGSIAQISKRFGSRVDSNGQKVGPAISQYWFVPEVAPLSIQFGRRSAQYMLDDPKAFDELNRSIQNLRRKLFIDLGIVIPDVAFSESNNVDEGSFQLALHEIPMGQGRILPNGEVSIETGRSIKDADKSQNGGPSSVDHRYDVVDNINLDVSLSQSSSVFATARAVVLSHLEETVRLRAQDFLGIQEVQSMLDQLEKTSPALVHSVVPKPVSLGLLTEVLVRLVEERVSIRPLKEILEALLIHAPSESDPALLTESVRTNLKRHITYRYARFGRINVHQLDSAIEEAIRDAIHNGPKGDYLALSNDLADDIIHAVQTACTDDTDAAPIILTHGDIRRFMRQLISAELPEVAVMSYAELTPEVTVKSLTRVDIGLA